ncbi:hypothetical protein OK016_19880 [Vibrio chagasii]|nr:hypothetical protein [Vibrio chagasii]
MILDWGEWPERRNVARSDRCDHHHDPSISQPIAVRDLTRSSADEGFRVRVFSTRAAAHHCCGGSFGFCAGISVWDPSSCAQRRPNAHRSAALMLIYLNAVIGPSYELKQLRTKLKLLGGYLNSIAGRFVIKPAATLE